jgi:hypothetical protein
MYEKRFEININGSNFGNKTQKSWEIVGNKINAILIGYVDLT